MNRRYFLLAIFFIPLLVIAKPQLLSITGLDIFNIGDSGGEFGIPGGGQEGGFTGIPPPVSGEPSGGGVSGEETPPAVGGGGYVILEDVKIIPGRFNLRGFVGVNFTAKIYMKNNGNESRTIDFDSEKLEGILSFSPISISINPGEEKIIEFSIIPPNNPDTYSGNITLISGEERAEIPFTIRVVSEVSLFDILVDIPKRIKPGENLNAEITLTQAGLDEKEDVALIYEITDSEDSVVLRETQTIAVQGITTFGKEFETQNLGLGKYVLYGEVIYAGGTASSSEQFEITNRTGISVGTFLYYILMAILITATALVVVILRSVSKEEKVKEYEKILSQIPKSPDNFK